MERFVQKHINGAIKCEKIYANNCMIIRYWDMDGNFESSIWKEKGSNNSWIQKWISIDEIWISVYKNNALIDSFLIGTL